MSTRLAGAMDAAIDDFVFLNAMADDFAAAVRTDRSKRLNGAFKGIKSMDLLFKSDFKRLVVDVSASFTFSHNYLLCIEHCFPRVSAPQRGS